MPRPKPPLVVLSTAFHGCNGLPWFISVPIPVRTPDPHVFCSASAWRYARNRADFPRLGEIGSCRQPTDCARWYNYLMCTSTLLSQWLGTPWIQDPPHS